MPDKLSKSKIEVNAKSLRIPIYVIRSGKTGLTITTLLRIANCSSKSPIRRVRQPA
jgi:hypothetical protein